MELSGNSLQKIYSGPKVIDFGNVNIKSLCERTFSIKNDLGNFIEISMTTLNLELQLMKN